MKKTLWISAIALSCVMPGVHGGLDLGEEYVPLLSEYSSSEYSIGYHAPCVYGCEHVYGSLGSVSNSQQYYVSPYPSLQNVGDQQVTSVDIVSEEVLTLESIQKFFKNLPMLHTERLVLRKPELQDTGALQPLYASYQEAVLDMEEMCARLEQGEPEVWVVTRKQDGVILGLAGFDTVHVDGCRGVLYLVSLPGVRSEEGYFPEALQAIVVYGLTMLGFNKLEIATEVATGQKARNPYNNLGFVIEARFLQHHGPKTDTLVLGITRDLMKQHQIEAAERASQEQELALEFLYKANQPESFTSRVKRLFGLKK
jgi:RimJ/RimL family protein N-acetyltransferase